LLKHHYCRSVSVW